MFTPPGFTVHDSQVDTDEGDQVPIVFVDLIQCPSYSMTCVQDRVPSWRLRELENKQKEKDEELTELMEESPNAAFVQRFAFGCSVCLIVGYI